MWKGLCIYKVTVVVTRITWFRDIFFAGFNLMNVTSMKSVASSLYMSLSLSCSGSGHDSEDVSEDL